MPWSLFFPSIVGMQQAGRTFSAGRPRMLSNRRVNKALLSLAQIRKKLFSLRGLLRGIILRSKEYANPMPAREIISLPYRQNIRRSLTPANILKKKERG